MSAGSDKTGAGRRVAVSGASGLIGRRLCEVLAEAGWVVAPLVRRAPRSGTAEIHWDPPGGEVDAASLQGTDAVVHLAGENIAGGRWTAARKAAIRDSRVVGTTLLSQCLASLDPPPRVLVSASAIGFYGDRGDELLTEESRAGRGFLPEVCQAWEAATGAARAAGIRVVNLRIGVVLAAEGGALAKMLGPFKLGLGGQLGNGRQYLSWISRDDLVRAILHVLERDDLHGPVNAVAPQRLTNAEFTATLGRVLGRPTLARVPALAVRALFGEMGRDLLLASTRVVPRRLEHSGFVFQHPDLPCALRDVLARGDAPQ